MILLGKCLYEVSFEDWPAGILVNATLWRVDAPLTDTLMLCTQLGNAIGNEEPATSQSVIELADRMQVVEESVGMARIKHWREANDQRTAAWVRELKEREKK